MIYTNICGYFTPYFGGQKYFITFINDFSRYGYVFLLHEKSEALKAFKVYKAEVKNQLDRKIKIVMRFNRGDEYYGRYDESSYNLGPFVKFFEQHDDIVTQYTIPKNLQQNGVA